MIKLMNINKQYKIEQKPFYAIQDVNITILDRQMVFITGKSGSGKTTLLNILSGIDQPSSGKYYFNGTDIGQLSNQALTDFRNQYVSIVFQEYNLIESMTVKDNLLLVEWMNGKHSLEDIQSTLKSLGIEEQMNKYPYQLSGGQRQRVAIARAILKRPRILVADEPTGALDSETGKTIFDILKDLSKEMLVIVATHDLDSKKYADQVIEMIDGRIVSQVKQTDMDSNESVKLRKSQLKVRQAMMIGTKHFHQPWIKIVLMMLIMVTSMTLLGISQSATVFKEEQAIIESMDSLGVNTFRMTDTEMGFYQQGSYITNTDIESLSLAFPQLTFFSGYPIRNFNISHYLPNNTLPTPKYFQPISHQLLTNHQFDLIGSLPNEVDEIVISTYLYRLFEQLGYEENNQVITISSPNQMLGKSFMINGIPYQIVGIIDTKLPNIYTDIHQNTNFNEQILAIESGLHNYLFVHESLFNTWKSSGKTVFNDLLGADLTNYYRIEYQFQNETFFKRLDQYTSTLINYQNGEFDDELSIYRDDLSDTLTNDEVIISTLMLYNVTGKLYSGDFVSIQNRVEQHALNNFNGIETQFKEIYGESSTHEDYAHYIQNHLENEFEPGFTWNYFNYLDQTDFYMNALDDYHQDLVLKDANNQKLLELKIVGVSTQGMIVSNALYQTLITNHFNDEPSIIVIGELTDLKPLLKYTKQSNLIIENNATYIVDSYQEASTEIVKIAQWMTYTLMGLLALISYIFMTQNIHKHMKNIGILKALGIRTAQILWIFVSENIVFSLVVTVVSIIPIEILIHWMNLYIKTSFNLPFAYLKSTGGLYMSSFILLMTVMILGILHPILKMSFMKPIEIIRKYKI